MYVDKVEIPLIWKSKGRILSHLKQNRPLSPNHYPPDLALNMLAEAP